MVKEQLLRVRNLCFSLPEVTEKIAWGASTFRVKDKMIAMFDDHHHGADRIALWCHAKKEVQELLVESKPGSLFIPPYMGPKGWIGVHLDKVNDDELLSYIKQAYINVAPKKLSALLEEND